MKLWQIGAVEIPPELEGRIEIVTFDAKGWEISRSLLASGLRLHVGASRLELQLAGVAFARVSVDSLPPVAEVECEVPSS